METPTKENFSIICVTVEEHKEYVRAAQSTRGNGIMGACMELGATQILREKFLKVNGLQIDFKTKKNNSLIDFASHSLKISLIIYITASRSL